jgi:uncharacterized integral membrane protein
MRRRLKTTKKSKKREAAEKKKVSKKSVAAQKKIEEKDEKKSSNAKRNLEVRVLGRPQKNRQKVNKVIEFEVDREKELEQAKDKARSYIDDKGNKANSNVYAKKIETEEELNKHKMIIMWSGIIFFMIIIIFFWINNTKKAIIESRIEQEQMNENKKGWDELVDDVSNKINDMKSNLADIEEFEKESATSSDSGEASTSFKRKIEVLSEEEFNKINEKIEPELKDKIKFIY